MLAMGLYTDYSSMPNFIPDKVQDPFHMVFMRMKRMAMYKTLIHVSGS